MNDTLSKVFIFAAGAAVGAAVTWKILKTKYEQIAQEEIDSVKEMYQQRNSYEPKECICPDTTDDDSAGSEAYTNTLASLGYTNYSTGSAKEETSKEVTDMQTTNPYVISPEEFGEEDEYAIVSLTYYADGVLTDEMDEPIDDIDMFVGRDSLTRFGEYEDDSVFVRNDKFKCYYEILLDSRKFSDLYQSEE